MKLEEGQTKSGNDIIVIPTGFMLVWAAENCQYIRWSFAGDVADTERSRITLNALLDSFPEVKTGIPGAVELLKVWGGRL